MPPSNKLQSQYLIFINTLWTSCHWSPSHTSCKRLSCEQHSVLKLSCVWTSETIQFFLLVLSNWAHWQGYHIPPKSLKLIQSNLVSMYSPLNSCTSKCIQSGNRGSSVRIVTELRAGLPGFDSREGQVYLLFATGSGANPPSDPLGT
jgi:hypothetical protein